MTADKVSQLPDLDSFKQRLILLEKQLSVSVDSIVTSQEKSQLKLARYLDKLPIESHNKRYILDKFTDEQKRAQNTHSLMTELNETLEEMRSILSA